MVYLLDDAHQRLSFVVEEILLHIDLETRRTARWPEDIATALDQQIALQSDLPREPSEGDEFVATVAEFPSLSWLAPS